MSRYKILDQINQLDPERDNMRILYHSFGYEFSRDSIRSLEIALYRTYCVPSISALLEYEIAGLGPPKLVEKEKEEGEKERSAKLI